MNQTLTIARRELSSLFFSPVAYLVLAVFAFVTTGFFFQTFAPGSPAELRVQFQWIVWLLVFLVPAISMRLVSEEVRSGTLELLMTTPISDAQVVLGKWLGAIGFFLVLLVPVLVQIAALEFVADPDYGPIITGLVGLILVGGLFLAIGMAVSAMTDSQLVAFMITVLAAGFFTIGLYLLASADWAPAWLQQAMFYMNVHQQFDDFAKGLIDTSNFVYFISGIGLFLFFAVLILQSRRWR